MSSVAGRYLVSQVKYLQCLPLNDAEHLKKHLIRRLLFTHLCTSLRSAHETSHISKWPASFEYIFLLGMIICKLSIFFTKHLSLMHLFGHHHHRGTYTYERFASLHFV
mmetsp:Transcript_34994/g.42153  ORF Transcript_34994/g.42153 Transcript_34994/m.42153 type:complete len:108 (+) Transcript_34994:870-1193(+)